MGKLFSKIVSFFIQKPIAFVAVIVFLIAILFSGVLNLQLDEDIYSILPKSQEFKKFNNVIKENNLNKQIIFSINSKDKESYEIAEKLDSLSQNLKKSSLGLIKSIIVQREISEKEVIDNFYSNFSGKLTEKDYSEIQSKLNSDSISESIQKANQKLASSSMFIGSYISRDPLGLSWNKLKDLNPQSKATDFQMEDGIVFYKDYTKALFFGTLNFELNDNLKNEKLNLILEQFKKEINFKNKDLDFDYFGTFQISYENSKQIKKDTNRTLIISLSLIFLLLFVYYRSFFTPLYFILPTLFGGLCGLGFMGYYQSNISVISVATSAVLLGIVLDYSFHFFTHYKHSKDLLKTVEELTFPMLVGSFTTVAAFASLLFTDSIVLQNFGLIAVSTLMGAAIFTVLFLPVILHFSRFKFKDKQEKEYRFVIPKWVFKILLFSTIALTIYFYSKASYSKFDSDLNNLSFHSEELIKKEQFYTGINPKVDKKIHLIVSSNNFENAVKKNDVLFSKIESYKKQNHLNEVVSLAPFYLPKEKLKSSKVTWSKFWENRKSNLETKIKEEGKKYDFSESAFLPFYHWISDTTIPTDRQRIEFIDGLGLNNLIHKSGNTWSIITSVVVKRSEVEKFKTYINNSSTDCFVFDISDFAKNLMDSVKNDFNYLLLISSLIVFLTLLLIYGRIELAILNFLPMVVAWIWILGFSAVFDVKFNFVNIIIATFIFGLGDDFTIFVTEGLLQKYKYNKTILKSYYSAIILSAVSTIIGIGALYFAKHPSIHSIAVISVVGIICTLIVTLYIQPKLFNVFVQNRVNRKKAPITFFIFLYSIFLYSYFLFGCLVLNLLLIILIPLPINKKRKRLFLNFLVSKMAKSTLDIGVHIKRKIVNIEQLDYSKPSIIVANHSSFLDILLMLQLNPKTIIMVKKWVYNSPFFGSFIRYSGYIFVKEDEEIDLTIIKSRIKDGYSIAIFPEGTRSVDGTFNRFHKGAFFLAKELQLDIQPIVIVGANYANTKNDVLMKSGLIVLSVMDRVNSRDPLFENRLGLVTKHFSTIMKNEHDKIQDEYFKSEVLRHRILYNFIFKGPILEWYIRVKLIFERKNFEFYDELIADRKIIYDIGCGYGYLSYYLHYRNNQRNIVGIDYDEDKIEIAENGYDKNQNLKFICGDVREISLNNADAIFYNDVLHYLTLEEQLEVLRKSVEALNENGVLFIRDGITDLEGRHQTTEKTEKYSTKIFNFNKITNHLSFFSSKDISMFAQKMNLSFEMIEQSKKTSNVLFILKKKIQ